MTEEDEKQYRNTNICRFCEKNNKSDKVRDDCHLPDKYRCPVQNQCSFIVTQKQSKFLPFIFQNFIKKDCHFFQNKN